MLALRQLIPEYHTLAHPNAQIDNAIFWRDGNGIMECGLIDSWHGSLEMLQSHLLALGPSHFMRSYFRRENSFVMQSHSVYMDFISKHKSHPLSLEATLESASRIPTQLI